MPCFTSISVYFYYIHFMTTTVTFPKDFKRQENLNFAHVLAFNISSKTIHLPKQILCLL